MRLKTGRSKALWSQNLPYNCELGSFKKLGIAKTTSEKPPDRGDPLPLDMTGWPSMWDVGLQFNLAYLAIDLSREFLTILNSIFNFTSRNNNEKQKKSMSYLLLKHAIKHFVLKAKENYYFWLWLRKWDIQKQYQWSGVVLVFLFQRGNLIKKIL